jgi:DNA end-binding protein Ku
MAQAVWTGHLSFGLVSIPVKLHTATDPRDVRFHQYDARTGTRVRYRRVAPGPAPDPVPYAPPDTPAAESPRPSPAAPEDEPPPPPSSEQLPEPDSHNAPAPEGDEEIEVPWEGIVKGFEIEPGRVVTVTPEELGSVAPERSRVLEVEQFVALEDIDPVHFEKSYYVVPQTGMGAERPYWLLYRAMERAAKVAVARFVLRTKEYLVAIRPAEHLLMLETLFYADEVRDPKEVWMPFLAEPDEREVGMARELVEAMTGNWEPARHRDEYRERLLELLRTKAEQEVGLVEPSPEAPAAPATDLIETLMASVEAAKQARTG